MATVIIINDIATVLPEVGDEFGEDRLYRLVRDAYGAATNAAAGWRTTETALQALVDRAGQEALDAGVTPQLDAGQFADAVAAVEALDPA